MVNRLLPWVFFVASNILTGAAILLLYKGFKTYAIIAVVPAFICFGIFLFMSVKALREQNRNNE